MKMKNYSVSRDNIYAGSLVRTCELYGQPFHPGDEASKLVDTNIQTKCRTMLFVPNERMFTNDLLYNSPSYPILNMTDPKEYMETLNFEDYCRYYLRSEKGMLVIDQMCYLGPFLQFLGYGKYLNYKQINEIRQQLFNGINSKECETMLMLIAKYFGEQNADSLRSLWTISKEDALNNELINKQNIFAPSKVESNVKRLYLRCVE